MYSDADISGELELGPYKLVTVHGGSPARPGLAAQRIVLRHVDHLLAGPPDVNDTSDFDVSGWTGGTLGDQMAALLALALARRVRGGGVVRQGFSPGDPLGRLTHVLHREPLLAEPDGSPMLPGLAQPVNIAGAVDLLERYAVLSGDAAAALTRAAGQFADAIWWADADPRIAWLKLVGALEAAANWTTMSSEDPVSQLKRFRGALYGRLRKTSPDAIPIVAMALAGTMLAEKKLVDFTVAQAPKPPDVRPTGARVDFSNLEPVLSAIYDCRSRDLHDAIPFPQPLCEPPMATADGIACERFPVLAASGDGGVWGAESLPICLHTFAHIVGEALRRWWATLPAGAPTA